jgi:hypothetical protein
MSNVEKGYEHIGKALSGEERLEELKARLPTEFANVETFTLEDVNDAFGDYTSDGVLYTEDELLELANQGFVYHDDETGEYSFTKEFVLDEAA